MAHGTKSAGLADLARVDQELVAKSAYRRREVRDPGSELDIISAAALMLEAQGRKGLLPWRRRRNLRRELQQAIARGYLNAPYTIGSR